MPRLDQYHREIVSGERRGMAAAMLRGLLSGAESFYSTVTQTRNRFFDRGIYKSHRAPRPVISVGNITTGGTGKTPVVRWLAQQLTSAGFHPAILIRGYKGGDEQRMLQAQLPDVIVEANPRRIAGAGSALEKNPRIDVFILDDGFQHRRLVRDFDLVLIDASNPFGFNHVLPRGLLREPLAGLARADAFLITHIELGQPVVIESALRETNPRAPIYRCEHVLTGLQGDTAMPLADLRGKKAMVFCGIGNPAALDRQIESAGAIRVGSKWFDDHHHYTPADLRMLRDEARKLGVELLITTEKDWIKLAPLAAMVGDLPPIYRAQLAIQFVEGDEGRLIETIKAAIESSPAYSRPGAGVGA